MPTWTSSRRTPSWTTPFPPSSTTPSSYGQDSTWRSPQLPSILRSLSVFFGHTDNITTCSSGVNPWRLKVWCDLRWHIERAAAQGGQLVGAQEHRQHQDGHHRGDRGCVLLSRRRHLDDNYLAGGSWASDKGSDSGSDGEGLRPRARHHCWPGDIECGFGGKKLILVVKKTDFGGKKSWFCGINADHLQPDSVVSALPLRQGKILWTVCGTSGEHQSAEPTIISGRQCK